MDPSYVTLISVLSIVLNSFVLRCVYGIKNNLQVFAETMEHGRDLSQEEMIEDIIRTGDDDVASSFLNASGEGMEDPDRRDASGEEMEGEADGSGAGTIIITNSGEVY